jgi:hypothetical protein
VVQDLSKKSKQPAKTAQISPFKQTGTSRTCLIFPISQTMFNEFDLLSGNPKLFHLLSHYSQLGETDPEAWQDRIMELEGVQTQELTRLYGDLLAHGWIAQNTGVTPILRLGAVPCCYRITPAGKRALKKAEQSEEEVELAAA